MTEARLTRPNTAFVLGGGGHLGAYEVGMLRAVLEAGIRPDVVLGTSVGALNGAAVAAQPDLGMVDRLEGIWRKLADDPVFGGSMLSGAVNLMRSRTALYPNGGLRRLIQRTLPVRRIEDLAVRFECVAASVERASEHWFTKGPLVDAILASSAVPGLLPPVVVDGVHYMDGGLVNSIPVERAVELGAREIFVLHVGRIEQPLPPPRNILQVAMVAFEVARRNRFERDIGRLPEGVVAHVLPTGETTASTRTDLSARGYRDVAAVDRHITRAHRATARYLARHVISARADDA